MLPVVTVSGPQWSHCNTPAGVPQLILWLDEAVQAKDTLGACPLQTSDSTTNL